MKPQQTSGITPILPPAALSDLGDKAAYREVVEGEPAVLQDDTSEVDEPTAKMLLENYQETNRDQQKTISNQEFTLRILARLVAQHTGGVLITFEVDKLEGDWPQRIKEMYGEECRSLLLGVTQHGMPYLWAGEKGKMALE